MGIEYQNNAKRKSKLLPFLLIGINLLVVSYLFLMNHENKSIISKQRSDKRLDSLTIQTKEKQILDLQSKIKKVIADNRTLGLTIGTMESTVRELEKLRKDIKEGKIPLSFLDKKISSIQKKFIAGKSKADSALIASTYIRHLRDSFNMEFAKRQDSIVRMMKELKAYEHKLNKAGNLNAANIKVSILNNKGEVEKIRSKYKTKSVKGIKVMFNIADNPIAVHCNRNFYLKIESPNGEVLKSNQSGKETTSTYTCVHSMYFNNTKQLIAFKYNPISKLKPGKYLLAIYNDESKIGEEVLYLR